MIIPYGRKIWWLSPNFPSIRIYSDPFVHSIIVSLSLVVLVTVTGVPCYEIMLSRWYFCLAKLIISLFGLYCHVVGTVQMCTVSLHTKDTVGRSKGSIVQCYLQNVQCTG